VIKLNDSFSGEGNALFRYPEGEAEPALREAIQKVEFSVPSETPEAYYDKFARMGGIVEEFIDAPEKHSPSSQLRISPTGEVMAISTRPDPGGLGPGVLGCSFPPMTTTAW
jgi:hypothetical protein